ncbi:MAG: hypothetical protein L0Y75_01665 [Acidobacteria bacterium]|nr:hypothetical protein [Acidobacteriota bacterium]
MKSFPASRILILSTLIAICAVGAAPSKFAGVWVLNRGKSEGLTGALANAEVRLIVTQDDKQITAEQKLIIRGREQPSQEFFYKFDGSETTAEVVRPLTGTMNLKARWIEASKTLELTSTITGDAGGKEATITTREQWQLVEGGKALKIIRTRESPQGKQQFKLHFDRQE